MKRRNLAIAFMAGSAIGLTALPALAGNNYPGRPIELAVIFAPAGGADTMGHKMSQWLAERYFMTSLANYDNDPTIFLTRPLSGSIMAFPLVFVIWALVPGIGGKVMRPFTPGKKPTP